MDHNVPDYLEINFAVDTDAAKQMIDWGVALHTERKEIREKNRKMYNSYNGIIDTSKLNDILRKRGETSATPYISYRIGRNKIKQLIGEFLQIGINATVFTINPEARKEKFDKYNKKIAISIMKPQLEKLRQMGMDVFPGVKLPDEGSVNITDASFKSKNEIIMQILIDKKISGDDLLLQFLECWKQLILTSEPCGKVERDAYYVDGFRPIPSENAIFLESQNEVIVKRSPIMGEFRPMFLHEIIREFKPDKDQLKKIKEQGIFDEEDIEMRHSGHQLYKVYSFQWLGKKTIRRKETTNKDGISYTKFISDEEYAKNNKKIESDIKKGKYKILDETDQLTIFEGHRIGEDVYLGIKEKEFNIVQKDETGIERLEFDYIFGLFNTVGGRRVPLQEVVYEMEKVYNAIRRQLNIEIGKIKGSNVIFDEAFLGKKTVTKIIEELSEHGVSSVNSSAPGMAADDRESVVDRVLKDFKIGDPQTMSVLMSLAMDIEQALDRQIGMNEDRQGMGQASSTATTNQNNVNASVSMTYDMFHFIQIYMNEVITRLLEKMKINWDWLEGNDAGLILSDEQVGYLKATKDLSLDSYGGFVTDGKLERDISRKLEGYFLQDINAGKLRTVDVAEFFTTKSFAQGIALLKKAANELVRIQQESEQQKGAMQQQMNEANIKERMEGREDLQQHDKDLVVLKSKMKENEIITKGNMEKGLHSQDKIRDHAREMEKEKFKAEQERDSNNV